MYCNTTKNYSLNFGARIRLSDKGLLNLPQKTDLLYSASPLDFFYKESKSKRRLDAVSIKIKDRIRSEQQKKGNSKFKRIFLRKSFRAANRLRTVASKIMMVEHIKDFYHSFKLLRRLNVASPDYIDEWAKIGNSINHKFINMNIEDGRIEKIAKSDDSVIFMLNHDNFERDKFMYPIFNSFLNYAYSAFGKQNVCPRPNIIVSKNFLKLAGSRFQSIYRKMGLVPIDASLTERNLDENVAPIKLLISKFAQNKSNLFIFPEGNNSIYKDKTLREKFQPGLVKIIRRILDLKSSVKIVPLGLSYGNVKNNMGNIYVGETILLRKINKNIFYIQNNGKLKDMGRVDDKNAINSMVDFLSSELEKNVIASKFEG